MPLIRFPCPQCQRVLKVGDQFAGRQAKCPGCQAPVTVPVESDPSLAEATPPVAAVRKPAAVPAPPPRPVPPPSDEDRFAFVTNDSLAAAPARHAAVPAPPQDDESFEFDGSGGAAVSTALAGPVPSAWKSVRTGVWLHQIAVFIRIAAIVLGFAGLLVVLFTGAAIAGYLSEQASNPGYRSSSRDSGSALTAGLLLSLAVFGLFGLALLAAEVLELVGAFLFLQVPERTGAKGFAIGVLICQCVILASPLLGCVGGMAEGMTSSRSSGMAGNAGSLLQIMAGIGWIVMLLLLFHKIGGYLQSEALCKEVVHFSIWLGVSVAINVASMCLFFIVIFGLAFGAAASRSSRESLAGMGAAAIGLAIVFGLIVAGVWIAVLVKYIQLLSTTQQVITRRAGKVAAGD